MKPKHWQPSAQPAEQHAGFDVHPAGDKLQTCVLPTASGSTSLHFSSSYASSSHLCIKDRPEGRGFFIHPACLRGVTARRRVVAGCPEAFDVPCGASVSVCSTVPCIALCKIFKAALWSRSRGSLQPGHRWVRTLKLFLIRCPQREHS